MPDTQLAVQLYTLRDYTKTAADFDATCKKIADQGWSAVQVSAIGPIDPAEVKKILDAHGLHCCATHERVHVDPDAIIEKQKILGCDFTAIGGFFPDAGDFTAAKWGEFIDMYNGVVDRYADAGIKIGYHNHSHEWAKFDEGLDTKRPVDLLVEKLDSRVCFEWDTYWVAHGGGCPATWLSDHAGRVPVIHVKDMGIKPDRTQYMMEVGAGNLDWPGILEAAKAAGVQWYVVEQDTCYRDPFDSLATSLANLKAMGLK
ncbi:MAG: sugar phosphate isomerase/epimerase [Planctomycetota bacterium]